MKRKIYQLYKKCYGCGKPIELDSEEDYCDECLEEQGLEGTYEEPDNITFHTGWAGDYPKDLTRMIRQ